MKKAKQVSRRARPSKLVEVILDQRVIAAIVGLITAILVHILQRR